MLLLDSSVITIHTAANTGSYPTIRGHQLVFGMDYIFHVSKVSNQSNLLCPYL